MLYSLFLKVAMLAMTMGVAAWIGWTVPQSRWFDSDEAAQAQTDAEMQNRSAADPAATRLHGNTTNEPVPERQQNARPPVGAQLDLNTATAQDLEALLPGIGPVLAERIVEYRHLRGEFRDVVQLRNVKGIGKKKFDRIRTLIRVRPPSMHWRGDQKTT